MAFDKKAISPVVIEVKDKSDVADFFVVCSASSARGVKTIADNIEKTLKDEEMKILGVEGYTHKKWILIDSADVVAHIFHSPLRNFYDIEGLYIDSPRIELTFDTEVPQSVAGSTFK